MIRHIPVVLAIALSTALRAFAQGLPAVGPVASLPPFDSWLSDLRAEALGRGIRAEVLDSVLADLRPVEQVLERDRTQAEFALDLDAYLKRRLTPATVRTAAREYRRHRALLQKVARRYDVDARILVAIWGLESNFGRFSGVRPTIATLATLAYDPRRSTLFRGELFDALEILNRGDIDVDRLRGSWAGALGQPQFMPSTYLQYAQDFDGDGRRDIWTSPGDVFASIAYYIRQHGWVKGQLWGREVRIPEGARGKVDDVPRRVEGCRAERLMSAPMPLSDWKRMGVQNSAGRPLPSSAVLASLVTAGSRHFLVYRNYETFLDYNCAHSYALSIALLADRIR